MTAFRFATVENFIW